MKKLFLAWREPEKREWIVVGKLWQKDNKYYFGYTKGVLKAKKSGNFNEFGVMQDIDKIYISDELFPIFKNRILNKSRPEYSDYIRWLGFEGEVSPLEELSRTNGLRATDSLQIFEKPKPINGKFIIYFFSHGIRHLPPTYQKRIEHLKEGERLYIAKDIQNKYDKYALFLRTDDPVEIVGYVPRFYTKDINKLLDINGKENVEVKIAKINLDAPKQFQLLCKLETNWPRDFKVCESEEFELIVT